MDSLNLPLSVAIGQRHLILLSQGFGQWQAGNVTSIMQSLWQVLESQQDLWNLTLRFTSFLFIFTS